MQSLIRSVWIVAILAVAECAANPVKAAPASDATPTAAAKDATTQVAPASDATSIATTQAAPASDAPPITAAKDSTTQAVPASDAKQVATAKDATTQLAATGPQPSDEDEVVCFNEKQTGTRFSKKVCKRRSLMRQESEQGRAMMRDLERRQGNGFDPRTQPAGP